MCFNKDIYLFVFLASFLCACGKQMPENIVTLEGQTITMILETNPIHYVTWLEYASKNQGENIYVDGKYVYKGDAARGPRYNLTLENNGSTVFHKFSVSNVALLDGGKYGAKNPYENDGFAQLIVLKNDIQCSISPNPVAFSSVVNIDCAIEHQGKWPPVMTCSSTQLSATSTTDTSTTGNATIRFSGEGQRGVPTATITCEAHFENPASASEVGQNEALNIPSYQSKWTGSVNVLFPATSITTTPDQSVFDVNDVIKCVTTGGSADPTYQWQDLDDSSVLATIPELFITKSMVGRVIHARCTAVTSINGVDYNLTVDKAFSVKEAGLHTTTIIIITIPTVMGVLGLIAAILVIRHCKKKARNDRNSGKRRET